MYLYKGWKVRLFSWHGINWKEGFGNSSFLMFKLIDWNIKLEELGYLLTLDSLRRNTRNIIG